MRNCMAASAEHLCIGPSLVRNRFTGLTWLGKPKKNRFRSTKFVLRLEKKRDRILGRRRFLDLAEKANRAHVSLGRMRLSKESGRWLID
ncbi:hypothetical protein EPI10_028273 [Gossypium australe]|uniref:Uncharacterized protein n=1 Tax=Gossypium australe TaxID=47621 RepID=A0A5B6UYU3_9ROSI|nr:hypothetical protein EPI10_028273 [Gossypium australe]